MTTSQRNVYEIARREIVVRGRSKGFIVSTILMAVVLAGLAVAPGLLGGDDDDGPGPVEPLTITVVGDIGVELATALDVFATYAGRPVQLEASADRDAATTAVSEGTARLGVDATVAPPELLVRPSSFFGDADSTATLLGDTIARVRGLFGQGLRAEEVAQAMRYEPVALIEIGDEDGSNAGRAGLAYAGLMFVYTTMILYGTWMVNGVVEEKSNRVVEVLLATVRPRDLLAGKVAGLTVLGVLQVTTVVASVLLASFVVGDSIVSASAVPALLGIVGWWLLGFLFFGVVMAAFGALVSRAEETQAAIGPVMVLVVAAMMAGFVALEEPNGTIPLVASFVPFTAPLVMTVRTTLVTVPLWQIAGSVAAIVLGVAAMTVLGGRIYAGAVMRTHGRVKLREAWRAHDLA